VAKVRPRPRRVAVIAFPGVQLLDVTGPLEVFGATERYLALNKPGARGYAPEILAERAGPVLSSSNIGIVATGRLPRRPADFDTVLVAGGGGVKQAMTRRPLLTWLVRAQKDVRRLGSVCTGAFVLAAAGLLRGRRAVTHWESCRALEERFPGVTVERDALYLRDRGIVTSAGVTAGMDLALALVEEDHGREVSLAVARQLVLFLYRPGGQSQFSPQLRGQLAERAPIREVQSFITAHPDEDLSVAALAKRAALSPRQFARLFKAEVGLTPARFVESARLEVARRKLESTREAVGEIAARAGFGSAESLRRRFRDRLSLTPSSYRATLTRKPRR
jgi:transcriptional regulator GlxA family with amidase domain